MPEPEDDPLPRLRAELDQDMALAPELARVVRGFVEAFESEGFSRNQALYLTMARLLQTPGTPP